MPETLAGRRVLVVEDDYFLANELEGELRAVGAVVLGPVPTVAAALDLLQQEAPLDVAVLDVNLGGEWVFPVADALAERRVPFLFTTGYDQAALPVRHASVLRLEKPVEATRTLRELRQLLGAA